MPAIVVGVVMAKGGNVLTFGKNLEVAVDEVRAKTPVGIEIEQIADQPKVVEEAVSEFTRSFIEALIIVLLVSFASLARAPGSSSRSRAACAGGGVHFHEYPRSRPAAHFSRRPDHRARLLVDDAIIAVEMMMVKMEQGFDRVKAATFAWESTAFPMLTGTLITAAGFMPVGFANSSTGEYTAPCSGCW